MPDNVELVRAVLHAMVRGDFDAAVADFSDTFKLDFSNSRSPMSGIYHGRKEARDFLTSFWEPWDSIEMDLDDDIVELEDGVVLSATAVRVRGTGSGVEVTAGGAIVWTLRDGEILAAKMYQSKDEALDAVS